MFTYKVQHILTSDTLTGVNNVKHVLFISVCTVDLCSVNKCIRIISKNTLIHELRFLCILMLIFKRNMFNILNKRIYKVMMFKHSGTVGGAIPPYRWILLRQ